MDVIGWLTLGLGSLFVIGSSLWSLVERRDRAAGARRWATGAGLVELPFGVEGVAGDLAVHRRRAVPSFLGELDARQVSVIATSTSVRLGTLWVLCTRVTRPPVFVANVLGFGSARLVGGGRPKGWSDRPVAELGAQFFVSLPPGGTLLLSTEARAALLDAGVHAFCFSVNGTGLATLWFKQLHGQNTVEALTRARALLRALLM